MSSKNKKVILIYVTCPTIAVAKNISLKLLESRLIACANILTNMQSFYKWKDRVCADKEIVLILKSTQNHYSKIEKLVTELHPYDCPCIISWPITRGKKEYLEWVAQSSS